ncbi:hypothetical protein RHGRI_035855 [Rhododendron griersonianum]|uniref:Uncharacterized protein n=1 Tax=Rhododendron griersonianum TaxID=479676 RepID=A0AAV6HLI9_9ERIC|nr:hypothetical protein RHGRI_035855 [Rhododendron griersonianum]KAG5514586.1 hypothetical protein RHGRI_035855 [Rhododendron griersonianum]
MDDGDRVDDEPRVVGRDLEGLAQGERVDSCGCMGCIVGDGDSASSHCFQLHDVVIVGFGSLLVVTDGFTCPSVQPLLRRMRCRSQETVSDSAFDMPHG